MRTSIVAVAGLLAVATLAETGPVKVTIQTAPNQSGEAATLPIDPKPRVRYACGHPFTCGWRAGGERLYSPQGGRHDGADRQPGLSIG
jgi:hypothetical protein